MNKPKTEEEIYADLKDGGRINARIIDARAGLRVLDGVYAVRIHSRDFYALIMNDYLPTLGKVEGDVIFLNRDGEYPCLGVRGFYKHQHNEFTLLIEEHTAGNGADAQGEADAQGGPGV